MLGLSISKVRCGRHKTAWKSFTNARGIVKSVHVQKIARIVGVSNIWHPQLDRLPLLGGLASGVFDRTFSFEAVVLGIELE